MAVLKADPEYRRKVTFVFAVAMVSGYAIIQWGLPAFESFLKQKESAEAVRVLIVLVGVVFLSILPWSIYMFRYARRILSTGQYPPAGVKGIRDTEILEGEPAHRKAHIIIVLSLLSAMVALFGALYFPYSLNKSFYTKNVNQIADKTLEKDAATDRRAP